MRNKITGVWFVQILLFTLSLWVVETIISGFMSYLIGLFEDAKKVGFSKPMTWVVVFFKEIYEYGVIRGFLEIFLINFARLLFYYPLYLPLFTLVIFLKNWPEMKGKLVTTPLRERILSRKRVLKVGILNSGLYILLSLLYGFILMPWTYEYFSTPLFPVWIISTFLSPFVLCKIPFYRIVLLSLLDKTNSWR